MKLCAKCGSIEVAGKVKFCDPCKREKAREKSAAYHLKNRPRIVARFASKYAEAKRVVFRHYGSACTCCGESEQRFLTLDHVDNDGFKWRGGGNGQHKNVYQWLTRNGMPAGFQVLCMNCNTGKHRNGGICPHQEGSTTSP